MSDQSQNNAASPAAESQVLENQIEGEEIEASAEEEQPKPAAKEEKKTEEVKKRLKKLKLKVDNKEYEEELPFEIDDSPEIVEYMTRQLQLAKMGPKRAQEKAELENELIDFFQELRTNPKKALSNPNIGLDVKKLAQEIIEDEIENMKKSPEQLKSEQLENELKEVRAEREKEKKDAYNRDLDRLEQQEFERYDTLVSQALDEAKLPRNPGVIKRMADNMLVALEEGIVIQPAQVANIVREEMLSELKELMGSLPEEALEEFIGKEIFEKVRKRRVSRSKANPPTPLGKSIQDTGGKPEVKKSEEPKKTFKDFFGV